MILARHSSAKRKRAGRWVWRAFALLSLAALLVALRAWWLIESTPDYWFPPSAPTPKLVDRAARFEKWVPGQFTQTRPLNEPWSIEFEAGHINEWLAARMPKWAANQGVALPEGLKGSVFTIRGDRLIVAALVEQEGKRRVVSAAFRAENGETNKAAELVLGGVYVGKLRVPMEVLLDLGGRVSDPESIQQLRDYHERFQRVRLSFDLDRVRRVEITNIALDKTKVILTCRTLRR